MNFAHGVIAAVGVLIAFSLGMIAADPGYVPADRAGQEVPEAAAAPMSAVVSMPEGSSVPGCEASDECFIPFIAMVAVGGTVTWDNADAAAHTVTSGILEEGHDGVFDSGLFMAGATFDHTFDKPGEYDYFCLVHPWMVGKVSVS